MDWLLEQMVAFACEHVCVLGLVPMAVPVVCIMAGAVWLGPCGCTCTVWVDTIMHVTVLAAQLRSAHESRPTSEPKYYFARQHQALLFGRLHAGLTAVAALPGQPEQMSQSQRFFSSCAGVHPTTGDWQHVFSVGSNSG